MVSPIKSNRWKQVSLYVAGKLRGSEDDIIAN